MTHGNRYDNVSRGNRGRRDPGNLFTLRLIYYIFYMIANWKIFSKAGEPGWKSLIPFYNVYTEYKLMWKPQLAWTYIGLGVLADIFLENTGTSALMFLGGLICTIAYLVIDFKEKQHVSKAFGHGFGFGVGLFFLQPIFSMILGFGSDQYQGNQS